MKYCYVCGRQATYPFIYCSKCHVSEYCGIQCLYVAQASHDPECRIMSNFLREYARSKPMDCYFDPTDLDTVYGQMTMGMKKLEPVGASCFLALVKNTLMQATLAGGGKVWFEAADKILDSVASARGGPAFLKDDYFFPHYAQFRLFVYAALEQRTEAREFLISLALRYKKETDDVKIIQTAQFLWELSVTHTDLVFYCIVVVTIWELEHAKKAAASGDASKAGRVGEVEKILTQLAGLFKESFGTEKEEYDLVVTFLKSNGDLPGVPPQFIGLDKKFGPVFCKSLMKMVKFGPTFVEFLEKTQRSENP
jgi:hypothetical protein